MTEAAVTLQGFELFAQCPPSDVARLVAELTERRLAPDEVLIEEGAIAVSFFVLVEGTAVITRSAGAALHELRVGPGSILGELGILRARPRGATVRAAGALLALEGDAAAFSLLLSFPTVRQQVVRTVTRRLAQNTHPVATRLRDATPVVVRPILPSDREVLSSGLEHISRESRRRRFFSNAPLSEHFIDYLVDIDYLDHFGWIVTTDSVDAPRWVGSARYVRDVDDPHVGDIGIGVVDDFQGRGAGALLMGALGVVAPMAGMTRLRADVLAENAPMRAVLVRAGSPTSWKEPGVLTGLVDPTVLRQWLSEGQSDALARSAREILIAAHLALTDPAPPSSSRC